MIQRSWKRDVATILVTVICMLPVGLAYTAIQVKHAQRRSDVISCEVIDRFADGMSKLVDQLRAAFATSTRTKEEKAVTEQFYTLLLSDFPKLDCTANPIDFVGTP